MASYYKRINGKNYDKKMIESAEEKSGPDGKSNISLKDAKTIIETIKDGGRITDIERRTLSYILETYSFSETALKWIENFIAKEMTETSPKAKAQPKKKAQAKTQPKAKAKTAKPVEKPQDNSDKHGEEFDEEYVHEHEENAYIPQNEEYEDSSKKKSGWIIFFIIALVLIITAFFFFKKTVKEEQPKGVSEAGDQKDQVIEKEDKVAEDTKITEKEVAEEQAVKKDAEASDGKTYVVKDKDTLTSISRELYGDYSRWNEIYRLNKETLTKPSVIFPGQKLILPE